MIRVLNIFSLRKTLKKSTTKPLIKMTEQTYHIVLSENVRKVN